MLSSFHFFVSLYNLSAGANKHTFGLQRRDSKQTESEQWRQKLTRETMVNRETDREIKTGKQTKRGARGDRETDRQTQTDRQRQGSAETETGRQIETGKETDRDRGVGTHPQKHREADCEWTAELYCLSASARLSALRVIIAL